MYLKAQLERYAATNIPNLLQKQAFDDIMNEIPFDERGMCLGDFVERKKNHPLIGHLIEDFQRRHAEFLVWDDLQKLTGACEK